MKMKLFGVLLVAGIAFAAPSSHKEAEDAFEKFYTKKYSIYKSDHDIVKLYFPLFEIDTKHGPRRFMNEVDMPLYFVLGDKTGDKIDYKGLYMRLNGVVTKILDNGVDMIATKSEPHSLYIAATDGIYKYNFEKKTIEKYGSITDSIIDIEKSNKDDVIYILSEDNSLYKVTDGGNKKVKVNNVKNAQRILLDDADNMFYFDNDKNIYIVNENGAKKVTGLPQPVKEIMLIRLGYDMETGGILVKVNDHMYGINLDDATLEDMELGFNKNPTALSIEGVVIQFYGYNKNIYENNTIKEILKGVRIDDNYGSVPNDIYSIDLNRIGSKRIDFP